MRIRPGAADYDNYAVNASHLLRERFPGRTPYLNLIHEIIRQRSAAGGPRPHLVGRLRSKDRR